MFLRFFVFLLCAVSAFAQQDRVRQRAPTIRAIVTTNFVLEAGENQTIPGPVAIAQFIATLSVEGGQTNGVVTEWTYTDSPGVVVFASRTGLTNSGQFSSAGRYQINVRTYNGAYEVTDNFWVFVNDQAITNFIPTVEITGPPNGATYTAPIDLLITADATDKDGTVEEVVFYNGPTILGTSTVAPYFLILTNAGATNYALAASVKDNRGATNLSSAHTVLVNPAPIDPPPNTPPVIAILSPTNATTWTNPITLAFTATASDVDGPISSVVFTDNGFIIMTDIEEPYAVNVGFTAGVHELVATAQDDLGSRTSATNTITVVNPTSPNAAPVVTFTAPANGANYMSPASVIFSVNATDSDGTIGYVSFYKNGALITTDSAAPYTTTMANLNEGTYVLSATATDNRLGVGSSTNRTITVGPSPGVPPVVSLTSPTDGQVFTAGSTILLSASATDSDGSVTNVSWWYVNPESPPDPNNTNPAVNTFIIGDTSSPYSKNWTPPANGYGIIAVASDDSGLSSTTAVANITVRMPIPPSVTLTSPTNGQVFTAGDTIPLAASIVDPDSLATSVSFWQYQPDNLISTDSASPFTGSWVGVPAGNYSLVAKVNFSSGQVSSSSAISITINPATPVNVYVDAGPAKTAQLSVYKPYLDAEKTANISQFNAYASSTGASSGLQKYELYAVLNGYRDMYFATLETNYINQSLIWCEMEVAAANITDNQGRKNWGGPWASPYSATPISYELYDIQGGSGMSATMRVILTDPELRAAFGARALTVYQFLRDHIVDKSLVVRNSLPWYRNILNNPATGTTDKPALMGGILLDLKLSSTALGNGDNASKNYPALVTEFGRGVKDWNGKTPGCFTTFCYQNNPSLCGLIWQYGHTWQSWTVFDTAHAERMPDFVIDYYRVGETFTATEVLGLAHLFTRVIWTRDTANPQFRNFIDGSNGTFLNRGPYNNGKIFAGWSMLSEFDAESLTASQAMLRAIKNGVSNPSISYNNSFLGRSSLAGHLAKAVTARVTPPYARLEGIVTGTPITSTTWTRTAGPGTATILKPTMTTTTVIFGSNAVGNHTFRLSVVSGTNTVSDTVTVNLLAAPAF